MHTTAPSCTRKPNVVWDTGSYAGVYSDTEVYDDVGPGQLGLRGHSLKYHMISVQLSKPPAMRGVLQFGAAPQPYSAHAFLKQACSLKRTGGLEAASLRLGTQRSYGGIMWDRNWLGHAKPVPCELSSGRNGVA